MRTRDVIRAALAGAGTCLQALVVLASGPASAADISRSEPTNAGEARVWFLHDFDPVGSFDPATIYANNVAIGESWPGTVFSVELAPGTYTFKVPNSLPDGQQAPIVQLFPNTQVYFRVDSSDWLGVSSQEQDHARYTLDLQQISAPLAEQFLPTLTRVPGS
jgi:hypothetical protein